MIVLLQDSVESIKSIILIIIITIKNQQVIHNRKKNIGITCCVTVMSDGEILDHFPVFTFVGQREWSVLVTSLVDWLCACIICIQVVLSNVTIDGLQLYTMLTFRITMMLVHKVLDCVQVAVSTGQREWSVTSLVDCTCGDHH